MIRRAAFLLMIGLPILSAACASRDSGGKGSLPQPGPNPPVASYMPERPLVPGPGGAFSRDVFRTDSGHGYTIEVRDYLAPLNREVTIDFGGAAVVEVRQGAGDVSIAGEVRKVVQGTVFTVGDDQTAQITARGEPMILRAWIYR